MAESERATAGTKPGEMAPGLGAQRHEGLERRADPRGYGTLLNGRATGPRPVQPPARHNGTGLPDRLKTRIEALSGLTMDDVRVHYRSARPAQVQAHAFTQGTQIHIAPGQERHLAHEAWHVVQQKQGRVAATVQFMGAMINDSPGLEREADQRGADLNRDCAEPLADGDERPPKARPASAGGWVVQRTVAEKQQLVGAADSWGDLRANAFAGTEQIVTSLAGFGGVSFRSNAILEPLVFQGNHAPSYQEIVGRFQFANYRHVHDWATGPSTFASLNPDEKALCAIVYFSEWARGYAHAVEQEFEAQLSQQMTPQLSTRQQTEAASQLGQVVLGSSFAQVGDGPWLPGRDGDESESEGSDEEGIDHDASGDEEMGRQSPETTGLRSGSNH